MIIIINVIVVAGFQREHVVNKTKLLTLTVAVSTVVSAWAEQGSSEALDTLVVQGDLFEGATQQEVFDHAGGRTLVDSAEIDAKGADNVRDALKGVPGIFTPILKGTGSAESG